MKSHHSYLRHDKDYSSFSSASGRTSNTWSSSNQGLIQLGEFKIAPTETDDFSMGDEDTHRFSVIIHDNTDSTSFENASSGQIDALHGLEDPNVSKKSGSGKYFSKVEPREQEDSPVTSPSPTKKGISLFLRKPSREIEAEEDSFDRVCNAFEGFVCRPNEKRLVPSSIVPAVVEENKMEESRDALDTVPEGEEEKTTSGEEEEVLKSRVGCKSEAPSGSSKQEQSERDSRDALDKVFDGVEIMTCGPDSSHNVRPAAKKKSVSKKTHKSAKNVSSASENIFDSTCESIEHFMCRMDTMKPKFSQEPDLLDKIFDGTTSSQTKNKSKDTSKSEESREEPEVTKIIEISNSQDDALDLLCSGVEYTVCRSQAVAVKQSKERDFLDEIFDPSCNGNDDNDSFNQGQNSLVASVQSGNESLASVSDVAEREVPHSGKKEHKDFLDYFFESIESRTCQPDNQ